MKGRKDTEVIEIRPIFKPVAQLPEPALSALREQWERELRAQCLRQVKASDELIEVFETELNYAFAVLRNRS